MAHVVLFLAVLLPVAIAAAFLLSRHLVRRSFAGDGLSPVTRQHIELFQGGRIGEATVEAAKARLLSLLERGDVGAVEASLRPGTQFVVQVRALAEIGTDDAGRILERQLQRRLTDDRVDQAWYRIDLAGGLRTLGRPQSLPHLLRCAESADEAPLGHFFAAETVCFLGFEGYLREPGTPLGRAALRVLHRALEGLGLGVGPQMVVESRLGEMVEGLWDHRPEAVQPLVVRVFAETLRQLRRAPHAEAMLADEPSEQEAFRWQTARWAALEPLLQDYLGEATGALSAAVVRARGTEQRDVLRALADLRAEAGPALLGLLERPGFEFAEEALLALTWSRDPRVGGWLRDWAIRRVEVWRRVRRRKRVRAAPARPGDFPYAAVLRALRGHPSAETEAFLVLAVGDWDPAVRAAAAGGLGWWEPYRRGPLLDALQDGRHDPSPEVRQAARGALARLGERMALQWFRHALTSEDSFRVHEAIQVVAAEGLVFLWPDLDRLADADDADVAHHARQALERMAEDMAVAAGRER